MTTRLGQSVVIENRPGAGTSSATKQVQSAAPDGYTLLMMGQTLVYVGLLYPDIGFDPAKAFAPVATLAGWSHVMLVANDVPAKSVKELVAYAKANPGKLTFGYGLGTSPQIVGVSLQIAAGLDVINVLYKGGEQVRVDLLGGRIHINFAPVSNALAMIQEGPGARTRGDQRAARPRAAGRADHEGKAASPMSVSIPTSGRRSWRRSARLPRSSTGSMPRSTRGCARPRCRPRSRSCASSP